MTSETEKGSVKKQPTELKDEQLDAAQGGGVIESLSTKYTMYNGTRHRKVTDGGLGDDDLVPNGT